MTGALTTQEDAVVYKDTDGSSQQTLPASKRYVVTRNNRGRRQRSRNEEQVGKRDLPV